MGQTSRSTEGGTLIDRLAELAERVRAARGLALFLDFDGTLAPIAPDPAQVRLPAAARNLLETLARQAGVTVAIISGRALLDLRQRVRLPRLVYAGNHGLEIQGGGLSFIEPSAMLYRGSLARAAKRAAARLRSVPGVQIENKGLTVSVHFRHTPLDCHLQIRRIVMAAVGEAPFRITKGRYVYEIRPDVPWDKGAAVRWIQEQLGLESALTLYIGDDTTDEHAFRRLTDAITVRVGRAPTHARFAVDRQEDVSGFLGWLARIVQEPRDGPLSSLREPHL